MHTHTHADGEMTLSFEASELGMEPGGWLDPINVDGVGAHLAEVFYNEDGTEVEFVRYYTEAHVRVDVYND